MQLTKDSIRVALYFGQQRGYTPSSGSTPLGPEGADYQYVQPQGTYDYLGGAAEQQGEWGTSDPQSQFLRQLETGSGPEDFEAQAAQQQWDPAGVWPPEGMRTIAEIRAEGTSITPQEKTWYHENFSKSGYKDIRDYEQDVERTQNVALQTWQQGQAQQTQQQTQQQQQQSVSQAQQNPTGVPFPFSAVPPVAPVAPGAQPTVQHPSGAQPPVGPRSPASFYPAQVPVAQPAGQPVPMAQPAGQPIPIAQPASPGFGAFGGAAPTQSAPLEGYGADAGVSGGGSGPTRQHWESLTPDQQAEMNRQYQAENAPWWQQSTYNPHRTWGEWTGRGASSRRTSEYMEGKPENPDDVSIVVVLVQDEDGRILLVKRSSGEETRPDEWESPGGHRDEGETIKEAGKREVLEEVGLEVKIKPGRQYFTLREGGFGVMLRGVPVAGDIDLKLDEHDAYEWVRFKDLKKERFQPQPPDFIQEVKSLVAGKDFVHDWFLITGSDELSEEVARKVRDAGFEVLSISGGSLNISGPSDKGEVSAITGLPSRQIRHHGEEFRQMQVASKKNRNSSKKRPFNNSPSEGLRVADHQPPAMRDAPEKVIEDTQAIFQQVEMPPWESLWGLAGVERPDYDAVVSPCSAPVQGPTSMDLVTGTDAGNAAYKIITEVLREEIDGDSGGNGCGCADEGDGKTATVTVSHPKQIRKIARKLKRHGFRVFKTRIPTQIRARLAADDDTDATSFSLVVQEEEPADVIEKETPAHVNEMGGGMLELTSQTPEEAADAMREVSELAGEEILLKEQGTSSSVMGRRRKRRRRVTNKSWY